ncbi:hypothetical protein [Adlercreutzia sp. ZJ141]|uniref:hypothetical protein n=1 Tax=Adlercreutzia sp. ZJ141 TaxID=2709406 RepID=UPI0013ECCA1B|nr:hypothetical protein [Adlercreutzia sp. ZJ141]
MGKKQQKRIRNSLGIEVEQLNFLRTSFRSELCALIPEDEAVESILKAVLDETGWEDHSGKEVAPPDFVDHERRVMIEAMRVDDHERPGDKKGLINPSKAHEGEIIKRYEREFGKLLDTAAGNARLTVLGNTDLPTEDDHSYSMYLNSFKRIVKKHASHANDYRRNYPGYKLVFYVFDESTGYFESTTAVKHGARAGDCMLGRPHSFYADTAFLNTIRNSNADYFLWYTPFKHEHLFAKGLVLPELVVYDVRRMDVPEYCYDPRRMVSTEV